MLIAFFHFKIFTVPSSEVSYTQFIFTIYMVDITALSLIGVHQSYSWTKVKRFR